jgi:hypothetical protein
MKTDIVILVSDKVNFNANEMNILIIKGATQQK